MTTRDALLSSGDVTRRLRIRSQRYDGVKPIPLEKVVGSVDRRSGDFDRHFRPTRRELRDRVKRMRAAFAQDEMPPIEVYEVGGVYFVVDGHHRVAVAREQGRLHRRAGHRRRRASADPHRAAPHFQGAEPAARAPSGSEDRVLASDLVRGAAGDRARPRPSGQRRARRTGADGGGHRALVRDEYLPALGAARQAELPDYYRHKTDGDLFLWAHSKLRELRTTNRDATWADAALAARREGVPCGEQRALQRERRKPLPADRDA